MEETKQNPIIKELAVILTKKPLVVQRYKHQEQLQHKNDCMELIQSNNKKQNASYGKKKRQNVNKKCKIILEKLPLNTLNQVQDGVHKNELVAVNKNVNSVVEGNRGKHLVYEHVTDDKLKDNDDLYEFDEADSENRDEDKAKRNKKKKVKSSKQASKKNTKKYKTTKSKICNTYDAAVQEILQKVMKRVNNGKLNKNPPPIQNEHHMHCPIQQNGSPEYVDDVGHYNDDDIGENALGGNKENEAFYEHNAQNNNSKEVCLLHSPKKTNKNIQVLSDITLDQSDDWFLDEHLQPNANSTVLLNRVCSPPWRFNEHLKRNPHYLSIKKTALPCLQQDMIIDYAQLEKIEEHFAQIPKRPKKCVNKSSPIKDSGLFHDTANKENIPHLSFFDSENSIVQRPKSLQENKQNRNILGPKTLNANNIPNDINVQRNNTVEIPAVTEIPISNTEKLGRNFYTSQNLLKEPVNKNFGVKLFEDEEPVINFDENTKIYISKNRKKKKLYDNNEVSTQDKHKREMTRKEEAELEQWATKFNSLCEDIDNYRLEIE
ncbi:uncharacterized protein LOC108913310 [Anoplophora glabripennis]|uniref:uncharacterized protein LOC108913310 n=1 Tax=Anoplophora glabripennis TaxID=217634 RepID=UPI000874068E|nr:uncharacterized protein LOC108913310 [Anoplophora glabripennis]